MWVQRSGALGVRQRRAVHQRQRIYLLDTGTGVDPSQTLWGSNSAKSFSIVSLSFPCPSSSLLLLLFPATKRPLKYRGIPLCECCKLHHWCLRTNMRVNTITTQFYPLFNITEHYSRLPSKHIYTGRRKKEKNDDNGKDIAPCPRCRPHRTHMMWTRRPIRLHSGDIAQLYWRMPRYVTYLQFRSWHRGSFVCLSVSITRLFAR